MSTILYNANSTLVSRFQRKLRSSSDADPESDEDLQFKASYPPDSRGYLLNLCCSIYPESVHQAIDDLPLTRLAVHAFFALMIRNFITSWYGTKIPTSDSQFIEEIISLLESVMDYLESAEISWEKLLCDDVPLLASEHIILMRRVMKDDLTFDDFLELSSYKGEYPSSIVDRILSPLATKSRLQSTFLDEMLGDLLLDRVLEGILEPAIMMEVITNISVAILAKSKVKQNDTFIERVLDLGYKLNHAIAHLVSLKKKSDVSANSPFSHRYIFTFFNTLFRLDSRKPLLYTVLKYLQKFAAHQSTVDGMLHRAFQRYLFSNVLKSESIAKLFIKLRHIIFPKDNKFSPERRLQTEQDVANLKKHCEDSLFQVCETYRLSTLLAISKPDIQHFIDAINRDKRMNKFLVLRLVENFVAHAT